MSECDKCSPAPALCLHKTAISSFYSQEEEQPSGIPRPETGFKGAPYTHPASVLVFCDYFQLGWIGMEICDEEKEVNGGGGARQMDC